MWFYTLGQESPVVDLGLVVDTGARIFRAVFWDVTRCSLVGIYQRFSESYSSYLLS
jgi:hypothetical protein